MFLNVFSLSSDSFAITYKQILNIVQALLQVKNINFCACLYVFFAITVYKQYTTDLA